MQFRFVLICFAGIGIGALLWAIHGVLLLPIRKGSCEDITVTVHAWGEAPELEMQLRGLVWLRGNGVVPCSIQVIDDGLSPEALAVLKSYSDQNGIKVSCERGIDVHG